MGAQQFNIVMAVWYAVFFAIIIFCAVNAIVSVKRHNRKFLISYGLELATVLVNLLFMYIIDNGFIDYGNHKFSGLDSLGDWLGFAMLICITLIPFIITVICNIGYVKRKKYS